MKDLVQYQFVLVDLNPTKGSEIKTSRPCLIVSPNEMNRHLRTIIGAPMTTVNKPYPTRVKIVHNKKKGAVALDQIRTIEKSRILKVLGQISKQEIAACKAVIKELFVD